MSEREVVLARSVYDELIDHALAGAPEEVCGVLAGERSEERTRVAAVHRTSNDAAMPETRYSIDPEEQLTVMEEIEDAGREVAGFYHSHPAGPPTPSETDARQATWEGYPYVIVALDGRHPYVGAWEWTGEEFERLAVAVTREQ